MTTGFSFKCYCGPEYFSQGFELEISEGKDYALAYRAWLMNNYGIAAIDAPTANRDNVEPAHRQHQEIFSKWLLTFGIDLNNY